MEEDSSDIIKTIFWIALIVFFIWLFFFSSKNKGPAYIKEEFKNGSTIDLKVDDSITSDNWECTGDCSGHEAGYEWASENGISDSNDCGGKSASFIEGCEAYANENY